MAVYAGPDNIEDGLVFLVDANNSKSYTGTNATWNDIAGGRILTSSNNPTYQSDGSFYFSGTPSSPSPPGQGGFFRHNSNCGLNGSVTLSGIVAPTYNEGPHKTIICTDVNYPFGVKLMSYKNSNRYGIWIGFGGSNATYPGGFEAFTTTNINDGTIKMVTGVWDQSSGIAKVYLNGSLTSTHNVGLQTQVLSDGLISVGVEYHAFGSGPYQGKIYQSSIHNRALSDTEVKQMYEVFKPKYNI